MITRAFGIVKFIAGFIIFGADLIASIKEKYESFVTVIAVLIVSLISGFYLYYFIRTGIWNLTNKPYKTSIILFMGILLHLAIVSLVDYLMLQRMNRALVAPFIIGTVIGFGVGINDLMLFYKAWKNKRVKVIT